MRYHTKKSMKEGPLPSAKERLQAITSLDGRYAEETHELSPYFSEAALFQQRTRVETEWLISLSNEHVIRRFTPEEKGLLFSMWQDFSVEDAQEIKEDEKVTHHDVKAVELFI